MASEKQKLLVIGMGSSSDAKAFAEVKLDGKTIDEYFSGKGIRVYSHPDDGEYLTTSIHRTTIETVSYAHDLKRLAEDHKIAAVFYGGLAFAMPGVVAAEACTVPVIAVGSDRDAFLNIYKIPDGTGLGVVGVGELEHGLLMAKKILDYEASPVSFIVHGDCKSAEDATKAMEIAGAHERTEDDGKRTYSGLTVCLSADPEYLLDLDKRVELGVFGVEKTNKSEEMIDRLSGMQNAVVVGRPKNLALYAARIVGLNDREVADALLEFRAKEVKKYPKRVPMRLEHFGGGE